MAVVPRSGDAGVVSLGRVVGALVLILVLYAVISQPQNMAAMTRDGAGHLANMGQGLSQFMTSMTANAATGPGGGTATSSSTDQVNQTPVGGAATGDGSTTPP